MSSPQPSGEVRLLVLPFTHADGMAMQKLFAASRISCVIATTMSALCSDLRAGASALIVSEEKLLPEWMPLAALIQDQPVWSDLPLIVLSRSGAESIALAQVIGHLGNVSVVERPVRTSTLLSLVRSNLRARARQYQVREHLAVRARIEAEREQLLESERAAREEAERSGRIKDEFLATLSHELRTPLNAILGWSQVLRRSPGLTDDITQGLTVIERNARSQSQIIEDLLDMSRIISGKVRLQVQHVHLAAIVDAALNTVRPAAQAKGIHLQAVLDPQAGPASGDPNRLQQVFWNLLTNAVKFTPKGGHVTVTLGRVGSQLEITVADTGEGIDGDFLPHIFDRFRQADASTTRRHGGLGLGLSIAKQLVELHGGTITVYSAGRGAGAVFYVRLPLMAMNVASNADSESAPHSSPSTLLPAAEELQRPNLQGLTVLVVDDEPDARALIRRLLEECGARVVTAAASDEAVERLALDRPDVLVSDIGMPGEDGYMLIRRVRGLDHPKSRVPAIALTAYARIEDRLKAIHAGYQLHLSKPVEPVELVAMVSSLAKRHAV